MPTGKKRPYTRKQRDAVKVAKAGDKAKKAGMDETPGGYKTAKASRARDTGTRPKKRNALSASKYRVKKAIAKGRKVKN